MWFTVNQTSISLTVRRVRKQAFLGSFDCVCCVYTQVHISECLFLHICLHVTYTISSWEVNKWSRSKWTSEQEKGRGLAKKKWKTLLRPLLRRFSFTIPPDCQIQLSITCKHPERYVQYEIQWVSERQRRLWPDGLHPRRTHDPPHHLPPTLTVSVIPLESPGGGKGEGGWIVSKSILIFIMNTEETTNRSCWSTGPVSPLTLTITYIGADRT